MNRAMKMILIGIGVAVVIIVLALTVFVSTFDLNAYKGRLSEVVKKQTGRELVFDGQLSLSLFPRLGVSLGAMRLSNADGFGSHPMVQVSSAKVSVKFMPLLKGEVRFDTLVLDGLALRLARRSDGTTNWEDIVGRDTSGHSSSAEVSSGTSLAIEGVQISDANLFWDDEKTGTQFLLRGIQLTTGEIYEGSPFPVEASLEFECNKPEVRGTITLTGKSSLNLALREYAHMDTNIVLKAEGPILPSGVLDANMAMQLMVVNIPKDHAEIAGMQVSAYGAKATFDGSVEGIMDGVKKFTADVTVPSFDARQTLHTLGASQWKMADDKALTQVGGKAKLVYTPDELHLRNVDISLDGTDLSGSARIKRTLMGNQVFARIKGGDLDVDRYLPPSSGPSGTQAQSADNAKGIRIIDSGQLRALDLDIVAFLAGLRVRGVRFQKVNTTIKARHGLVRLSPLSADMYGGSLSLGVTVNAMSDHPKTDVIAGVTKVDIGALSLDLLGDKPYAGILDFHGTTSCDGERLPMMLRSLNGKLKFGLKDGVFPGVDLMTLAKRTHEKKGEKGATLEGKETDFTQFGSIDGTGVITAGILRNHDLEIKAPGLRATGKGDIALPSHEIDYMLRVKLVPTSTGQGGKSSDELFGVMVPIHVTGTVEDPHYWVSITEYIKALGGMVLGTAGTVLHGVTGAIKGIGKAIGGTGGKPKKTE